MIASARETPFFCPSGVAPCPDSPRVRKRAHQSRLMRKLPPEWLFNWSCQTWTDLYLRFRVAERIDLPADPRLTALGAKNLAQISNTKGKLLDHARVVHCSFIVHAPTAENELQLTAKKNYDCVRNRTLFSQTSYVSTSLRKLSFIKSSCSSHQRQK